MNPDPTARNVVLLLGLSLTTSLVTRFAIIPVTLLDGDEGIYLLMGQEILHGVLPYQGSFDHKPVGLYYLFALAQLLFGQGVHAIRLLAILACGLTGFLLGLSLMAALRAGFAAAAVTAVLYTLASLNLGGLATNTEILLNVYFAAALATFHLARLWERFTLWPSLLVGCLLALMFHTNYLAGPPILGFGLAHLLAVFARDDLVKAVADFGRTLVALLVGVLCASAAILGPIALWSDLGEYVAMQAAYLSIYHRDDAVSFGSVIDLYKPYGLLFALYATTVGLALRDGIRGRPWRDRYSLFVIQISIFLVCALGAAMASGRFYSHYSILLLPGLTLAAGSVVARLPSRGAPRRVAVSGIVVLSVLLSIVPQRAELRHGLSLFGSWISGAPTSIFTRISKDINKISKPSHSLYVYQFNAVIHFLTGKSPMTRFPIDFHHLGDRYIGAFGSSPVEEITRILTAKPDFILVGDPHAPWNPEVHRILERELKRHYERIKRYRPGRNPVHLYRRKDSRTFEPLEGSTKTH